MNGRRLAIGGLLVACAAIFWLAEWRNPDRRKQSPQLADLSEDDIRRMLSKHGIDPEQLAD